MLIKELAMPILKEIENLKKRPETLNHNDDNLITLISKKFYIRLQKLLISASQNTCEANRESLAKFYEFCEQYWDAVKNTDMIFSHNYDAHLNRALFLLATKISEVTQDHPYKILMPTLKQNFSSECKLNEIVLSDDNKTIIDVAACLEAARKNRTIFLKQTHPMTRKPQRLSFEEKARVIKHSVYSLEYFNAICEEIKSESVEESKKRVSPRNIQEIQKDFLKNLGNVAVSSSYESNGRSKIAKSLYENITSLSDLVNHLLEYPSFYWNTYLQNITATELKNTILDKEDFINAVSNQKNYSTREIINRATLYTFAYLYKITLQNRKEKYKGVGGSLTGHSKEDKLAAVSLVLNFLSEKNLSEFKIFLQSDECAKLLNCLIANKSTQLFHNLFKPIVDIKEELHCLCNQILKITNPQYLTEIEKHSSNDIKLALTN